MKEWFVCRLVTDHPYMITAAGMWFLNFFAGWMTKPVPTDKATYKILFAAVHATSGALSRVAATMMPPGVAKYFLMSEKDAGAIDPKG